MNFAAVRSKVPILAAFGAALIFMLSIFTREHTAVQGAIDGLMLCANVIIPAVFPFMVAATFIVNCGVADILRIFAPISRRLFGLPGIAGLPIFTAFISGYPEGGRAAEELYSSGELSRRDSTRMAYFAVCAGPAFIIKAVGEGMLGSTHAGILLFAAHLAGAILTGILLNMVTRRKRQPAAINPQNKRERQSLADVFVNSTASSCKAMISICGFITLFSVVIALIESYNPPSAIRLVTPMLLEVTAGTRAATAHGSLPLISAVLAFGGLSVSFQILSFTKKLGLHPLRFLLCRILHAGLSAAIIIPLERMFPVVQPAFSIGTQPTAQTTATSAPASIALMVMGIVLVFSLRTKQTSES